MTLQRLLSGLVIALLLPISAFAHHSESTLDQSDDALTLGEAIVIALEGEEDLQERIDAKRHSTVPIFTDVSVHSELAPYAAVALEDGLVIRNIDRTLRPNGRIRAEEAIALLLREKRTNDEGWFVPAVRSALMKNAIADPRSMSVGGEITRGEFFDIAYRLEVIEERHLIAFESQKAQAPKSGAMLAATVDPTLPTILAAAPADEETRVRHGSAKYFSISIPALGIEDLTITHPEDSASRDGLLRVLDQGVGHLYSYPGKGGKIMIYGHSSDYAWMNTPYTEIFSRINELPTGEKIYVTYDGKTYSYTVTGQQVIDPDDTTPFEGDGEELILYTCWPPKSVDERLIVRAMPDQTVAVR